jgi:hypothetical protein
VLRAPLPNQFRFSKNLQRAAKAGSRKTFGEESEMVKDEEVDVGLELVGCERQADGDRRCFTG